MEKYFNGDSKTNEPGMPKVTTLDITHFGSTTASSGGNITDEGNSAVTHRGVIWGKNSGLSMNNKEGFTADGAGGGEYTSQMTGLTPQTNYFFRAYASNDHGVKYSYGEEKTFVTLETARSITITDPKNNQTLESGKRYTIRWAYEEMEGNATISLYKGSYNGTSVRASDFYKNIANVSLSQKSYSWTIGKDIEPGTYTLHISSSNIHAAITIRIEIPDHITVTSPVSSTRWSNGSWVYIKWESSGAGSTVKIEMYYKASNNYVGLEKTIISSTDNSGEYRWRVSSSYICSGCYKIKIISNSNTRLYGESDFFSIIN